MDPNRIQIARILNINPSAIYRWRKPDVGLPIHIADRLACQLGFHPSLIWGDLWWNDVLVDMDSCT
jgi:hypothetical protein